MNSFDILEELSNLDDDLLLRAQEDPPKRHYIWLRGFQKAAAACLICVLVFTALIATDAIAMETGLRWTVRYREDKVTWLFKDGTAQDGELPAYAPTWLPKGYVQKTSFHWETSRSRTMSYQNSSDEQDWITFHYIQVTDKEIYYLGTLPAGSYEKESVEIGGLPGELYTYSDDTDSGELVWIDRKNCMVFLLHFDNCGADVALQIAESVKLIGEE